MIDILIWGTILIIGLAISLITLVLGLYFMITKFKGETKTGKLNYKLEDQQEIK